MNWIFLAIIPPFLWSLVNHADKYLLSKYIKSGIGGLMIFSTIFSIIVLPILYFINPSVFSISPTSSIAFILSGILYAVFILLYLFALKLDEASIVVPFFLLVPILSYILGYFFLGEALDSSQMFAGAIILFGALILSLEIEEENKFKLKKGVPVLMFLATLCLAIESVIFKYFALDQSFVISSFWTHVGLLFFGLFLLFAPRYRKDFVGLVTRSGKPIFALNFLSETVAIIGNLFYSYATLLVPIIFVALLYPFQPAFVFIEGILLTIFLPHISKEKISRKHLLHKFSAIAIMFFGTYLLYT